MPDPTPAAGATPDAGATPAAGEPSGEPSSTASADGLGEAGRRALAETRRELKAAQKERDDLAAKVREREESEKSELEKATGRADAAESRVRELEHQTLQVKVATAAGIPQHWNRLIGATEEELTKDAEAFKGTLPEAGNGGTPSAGELGAGARKPAPASGSAGFSEVIRQRARR